MRVRTCLAAAAVVAVSLTGCGSGQEDDPAAAAEAVQDFFTAVSDGDAAAACDLVTEEAGDSCESDFEETFGEEGLPDEVRELFAGMTVGEDAVTLDEEADPATAEVDLSQAEFEDDAAAEGLGAQYVPLVYEDGWTVGEF